MTLLRDRVWKVRYASGPESLVHGFWVPALQAAVRYDRLTGYFDAGALALAARGVEELVRNGGKMRLIVGCTLGEAEVAAIEKGAALAAAVTAPPLLPDTPDETSALELLAWMVRTGALEVKVAVPCHAGTRKPRGGTVVFHQKAGVLEDKVGERIAFSGSINETRQGWSANGESFHVFRSWIDDEHLLEEERAFERLWDDLDPTAIVVDVPTALEQDLLRFLPEDDHPPRRLEKKEPTYPEPGKVEPTELDEPPAPPPTDPRRLVWSWIANAAKLPGPTGERVGEATSIVTPWPHQVRAFERMYRSWPSRLLIADEVGLGKTIQAGLLIRQAWLAERAKRILVMAPKAVLGQWQIELREKFALSWPIYDGQKLTWYPSQGRYGKVERAISREDWHKEPCLLVSSHLLRRRDRVPEVLGAEPWDLVILDEAHHARRSGSKPDDDRPNRLLSLMRRLKDRAPGLVLLTATPMQIHPVELYDLLALLGLPPQWHLPAFLDFVERTAKPLPDKAGLAAIADLFRAAEKLYGPFNEAEAKALAGGSKIAASRVLQAMRNSHGTVQLGLLSPDDRRAAVRIAQRLTPIRRLVSRNTRELLRRYRDEGKLKVQIADRAVVDRFIELTPAERAVYEATENYISEAWDAASSDERHAVGFVLTIYRRRLASSFAALRATLEGRLAKLEGRKHAPLVAEDDLVAAAEDDEELDDHGEVADPKAVQSEADRLRELIASVRDLPVDTKAARLIAELQALEGQGYRQAVIFTQYTDTLDFLREHLVRAFGDVVICFSGRGGERRGPDGRWTTIDREKTKERFRGGEARFLLCTDAAAEGLNFQFCGALVNVDMPWNPMRVEQRIGRIDRLGQSFPVVRIINLHYAGTVEADVYRTLRDRIDLFGKFVGKLQPILAALPKLIEKQAIEGRNRSREGDRTALLQDIDREEAEGFDLDLLAADEVADAPRPRAALDLADLQSLLRRPDLLPPDIEIKKLNKVDYSLLQAGETARIRITADAAFYEGHPDSCELFAPGSVAFLVPETGADASVTPEQGRSALAPPDAFASAT